MPLNGVETREVFLCTAIKSNTNTCIQTLGEDVVGQVQQTTGRTHVQLGTQQVLITVEVEKDNNQAGMVVETKIFYRNHRGKDTGTRNHCMKSK